MEEAPTDFDAISKSASGIFSKIPSVETVYISDANTVVSLLNNPSRMDRCLVYDAERALSKAHPETKFTFFITESAAKYGDYHIIYARAK